MRRTFRKKWHAKRRHLRLRRNKRNHKRSFRKSRFGSRTVKKAKTSVYNPLVESGKAMMSHAPAMRVFVLPCNQLVAKQLFHTMGDRSTLLTESLTNVLSGISGTTPFANYYGLEVTPFGKQTFINASSGQYLQNWTTPTYPSDSGINNFAADYPTSNRAYYDFLTYRFRLVRKNNPTRVRFCLAQKKGNEVSGTLDENWDHNIDHQMSTEFWAIKAMKIVDFSHGDFNQTPSVSGQQNLDQVVFKWKFPIHKVLRTGNEVTAGTASNWFNFYQDRCAIFIDSDDAYNTTGSVTLDVDVMTEFTVCQI